MKTLIITGGSLYDDFTKDYIEQQQFHRMIAVDKGMEFFYRNGMAPDYIVGDFDSANSEIVDFFRGKNIVIQEHKPEKDQTDTELAVDLALELHTDEIHILGGTGSRIDHLLGTIRVLGLALEQAVTCYLVDPYNRIRLINGRTELKKDQQYGYYVSLLPFTTSVEGLTLQGFKYPLDHYTMTGFNALGVSNEIKEEQAVITMTGGVAVLIESKDRIS